MERIFGYFLIGLVVLFMIIDIIYIVKKRNSAIHTNSILIYTIVPIIMILLSLIPSPYCYLALAIFIIVFMYSFILAERIALRKKVRIDVFNIKKENYHYIEELLNKYNLEYKMKKRKLIALNFTISNIDKALTKTLLKEINELVDSLKTKKEKGITISLSFLGYIVYIIFIYSVICTGVLNEIFK